MDAEGGLRSTDSVWEASKGLLRPEGLAEDVRTDVCVIGAGITGMTAAYLLARQGRSVTLVDAGPIGGGETKNTTAHLSSVLDAGLRRVERLHGEAALRSVCDSHAAAIDAIEAIAVSEGIECGLERVDGYLFSHAGDEEALERELASALRAGLNAALIVRAPLDGFDTGPCLRFSKQGQFDPLRYLAGLARCLARDGVRVHGSTRVTAVEGGSPARVETEDGAVIVAQAVVVAAHTPVNDRFAVHTKQAAYRTYVIGAAVPRGSVTRALYWDDAEPYHYARLQRLTDTEDMLLVGGEDHKTGQADDAELRYARLEEWARARFPVSAPPRLRWSGQVLETMDGLPFIGRNPTGSPSVYIATGYSGQGMTHGTIAGLMISDLILGRAGEWARLYDPRRRTLRAAKDYLLENLNAAARYSDWLTRGEVSSLSEIEPGSGAVVRRALRKLAVYRDEEGGLHARSAVCPHLGGIVCWNHAEQSWDCPLHGSRFTALGRVQNGPALLDLGRVEDSLPHDEDLAEPPPARERADPRHP